MASIEMSTHSGSLPPTLAGQDLVVSSSDPLATDTSPSNPASLASSGAEDLNADPAISAPQVTPTKLVAKRALWGWMKHTEIKTSPLTLVITLLGLIAAVIYGTSTWIQSSTAADATAKANRLALFTAYISFSDQPNIANSTFCRANSNVSLDGFAKRDTAAISPPVLWDTDAFAEALQIVQPVWQCRAVCRQEMVLHPPDLTLVLSFPMLAGENCHLDCFEPTRTTFWAKKFFQRRFEGLLVVASFIIIVFLFSRKCLAKSTLNNIVAVITYMCLLLCMASFISGRHHILYQRAQLAYQVINTTISSSLIGVITPSLFYRFFISGSKPPVWLKMTGWVLSAFNILERGPFTTDTALLLITHIIDLNLQYLLCLFCYRLVKGQDFRFPGKPIYPVLWTLLYIVCGIMCGMAPWILSLEEHIRQVIADGHEMYVLVLRAWELVLGIKLGRNQGGMVDQMNNQELKSTSSVLDHKVGKSKNNKPTCDMKDDGFSEGNQQSIPNNPILSGSILVYYALRAVLLIVLSCLFFVFGLPIIVVLSFLRYLWMWKLGYLMKQGSKEWILL